MIERKEFTQEIMLRENVRKAIRHVLNKRGAKSLEEETQLRTIIRGLLEGQSAVASVAKHDSTGINTLEDLLKNSNVLSVIETGYKSLTTDPQQRDSYKNHILNAVEKSLAPEEERKEAGDDGELDPVEEEIDISISDKPEDDPAFIDVEDKEEVAAEPDERDNFGIEGQDKTGRNRAYDDFHDIEKNILTAFDNLDNPKDTSMFEEYLLKNLALYFDKYESELQVNVEEPEVAANAVADEPDAAEPEETAPDTELPEFELEEGTEINLESLIDSLLQ